MGFVLSDHRQPKNQCFFYLNQIVCIIFLPYLVALLICRAIVGESRVTGVLSVFADVWLKKLKVNYILCFENANEEFDNTI